MRVIKKVGEERYFRNWQEFFAWQARQSGLYDSDAVFDQIDRMCSHYKRVGKPENADLYAERHCPNKHNDVFEICGDNYFRTFVLFRGQYSRKSGDCTLNVLAIQ